MKLAYLMQAITDEKKEDRDDSKKNDKKEKEPLLGVLQ